MSAEWHGISGSGFRGEAWAHHPRGSLGHNDISEGGARALADALAKNTALTTLDFLGFGLPPGSASLGELLSQGKNNLQAPWLAFTGFVVLGGVLTLLIFIGEAVRDAFDPRKLPGGSLG